MSARPATRPAQRPATRPATRPAQRPQAPAHLNRDYRSREVGNRQVNRQRNVQRSRPQARPQHRGGGGKDKVVLTSFPEPGAHDTFLTMQRQYGLNVYEDAQLLAVLKKKYGVTIYKEDAPPLADEQKQHSVGDKHDSLKKNRDIILKFHIDVLLINTFFFN